MTVTDLRIRSQLGLRRITQEAMRLLGDPLAELAHPGNRANPYPVHDKMRRRGPLWKASAGTWVATSFDVCSQLVRDRRLGVRYADGRLPAGALDIGVPQPWADTLLEKDEPDHMRLRRIATPAFSRGRMAGYRDRIEEITARLLDDAARAGRFDLVEAIASPLPITVIRELLGIPAEVAADFDRYGEVVGASVNMHSMRDVHAAREVAVALTELFDRLIVERTAAPGDDVISTMVTALGKGELTADELVNTASLLLLAGFETTVNLISTGIWLFLRHPEQWALLCEHPELAADAVEEVLRLESPGQIGWRITHEPVAVQTPEGTVDLPAGAYVLILFGMANRDPAAFPDPDRFDIRRAREREHLAFAGGSHYCLGAPLARMEGEIAFRALAERFPDIRRAGPDRWRPSLIVRGLSSLPVRVGVDHRKRQLYQN